MGKLGLPSPLYKLHIVPHVVPDCRRKRGFMSGRKRSAPSPKPPRPPDDGAKASTVWIRSTRPSMRMLAFNMLAWRSSMCWSASWVKFSFLCCPCLLKARDAQVYLSFVSCVLCAPPSGAPHELR